VIVSPNATNEETIDIEHNEDDLNTKR